MTPKNDIIDDLMRIVSGVEEGNLNPLEGFIALRDISKVAEASIKQIESAAMAEAAKHGKKGTAYGYEFTLSEGRRNYKFDHIEAWKAKKDELIYLEEIAKRASDNHSKGVQSVTMDGEVLEPAIVTYSKASLTLRKVE